MRLVWLDCAKIPGCGAEDWKALGTILRFCWLWALFVGFGFVGRFCVADEVFDEFCCGECEVFDCVHVGFLCSGLFGDELFVFSFDDVECDWCGDDGYVCE